MAVIKCKMCCGDLVIEPGSAVAECEFCGIKQAVNKVFTAVKGADSQKWVSSFWNDRKVTVPAAR